MTAGFTRDGLRSDRFEGFVAARQLVGSRCREVADEPGVYIVLCVDGLEPVYLPRSQGGRFKGKDPTVPVATLRARWRTATPVLYIGMAGSSLRTRVRQLVDYGAGRPVGHQGGRYLWQVQGCESFEVAWRPDAHPAMTESRLLSEFVSEYGALPFANLRQ